LIEVRDDRWLMRWGDRWFVVEGVIVDFWGECGDRLLVRWRSDRSLVDGGAINGCGEVAIVGLGGKGRSLVEGVMWRLLIYG